VQNHRIISDALFAKNRYVGEVTNERDSPWLTGKSLTNIEFAESTGFPHLDLVGQV
jgi:hypothetical protein